ncbi:ABC transporter ATP-binding protein [Inmirania thermothiophila]|uniref:Cu-processing system ATP-binding protein n=1 Tax=Inmirania thermothiophila TaxID=1750597 RepID=A0A3N1Y0M4_9GAMM|nr:ABC transporter ATP-binding protein [Inmirania thermothiophila]ROR32389.1 Cu-processing system ATP-binding protein [Inmirania thermothiophila]
MTEPAGARLEGVVCRFGRVVALDGVSLEVGAGEAVALLGHNGAGKTTVMKLLLGLVAPDAGRVLTLGADPRGEAGWRARARVGFLPENVAFYDALSGREVLHYLARLKGVPRREADRILEQVGLAEAADRRVGGYSKGMRQRLGLAQALMGRPRLLLLDEPTVGLDPVATAQFYRLLDAVREGGCAVLVTSHVLAGLERRIGRAVVLRRGRVVGAGTPRELGRALGLPVRIQVEGGDGARLETLARAHDARLAREGAGWRLEVAAQAKMAVLRALAGDASVRDLHVHEPTLEEIYAQLSRRADETEGAAP